MHLRNTRVFRYILYLALNIASSPTVCTSRVQPASISRRKFIRRFLQTTASAGLMVGGGGMYAVLLEPQWLAVERVTVRLKRLSPKLDGFRIAQLSDLHRGRYVSEEDIRQAVEVTNRLKPDLVVLTGDYVSRSEKYAESC